LAVAISTIVVYRNYAVREAADAAVAQSIQVLTSLERVGHLITELESAAHAFVDTEEPQFLTPFHEARKFLPEQLSLLRSTLGQESRQNDLAKKLEKSATALTASLTGVVESARDGGWENARRALTQQWQEGGVAGVRRLMDEMRAAEEQRLTNRRQHATTADRNFILTIIALGLLTQAILMGAYVQTRRHLMKELHARELLQLREENLSVTLKSIAEGVLIADATGRVTGLNRVGERLTSWNEGEALGQPAGRVFRIIDEETRHAILDPVEKVLKDSVLDECAASGVLLSRDGSERPVAATAAPILNSRGHSVGVVLVFRDVTAERSAEQALRVREERYRHVTEGAPFALFIQCEGRFAYMNAAGLVMFRAGHLEEIVGRPILEFLHPEYRESVSERIRRVNEERLPAPPMEQRWIRVDGTEFWCEATANPTSYLGKPGAIVVLQDITRRKEAEALAAEQEVRLRAITSNLPDGAVFQAIQSDEKYHISFLSPGIESFTGLPAERIIADPHAAETLILDESLAALKASLRTAMQTMAPLDCEIRYWTPTAETRWLHVRARPHQLTENSIQWDGVVVDVTSQKCADENLRLLNSQLEQLVAERTADLQAAELRYRTLFEESPDGVLIIDPATGLAVEFNNGACQQLGYTRDEFSRVRISDYEVLESQDETQARINRILREGREDFETQHRTKSGEIRDVHVSVKTIDLGQPLLHCIYRDITEQKRAEEAVLASEARAGAILDTLAEGVIFLDANGVVKSVNPAVSQVLGWTLQELSDPNSDLGTRVVSRDGTPLSFEELPAIQALRTGESVRNVEMGVPRPDGTLSWVSVNAQPLRAAGGVVLGVVASFSDINERRRIEAKLREDEEKLLLLISSVREYAIISLDQQGLVTTWNEGAQRLTGWTKDEILGRHHSVFWPREEVETGAPETFLKCAAEAGAAQHQGWRVKRDGSMYWGDVAIAQQLDERGRLRGFSKVICDRTEDRRAETELRAQKERLMLAHTVARLGDWGLDLLTNQTYWSPQVCQLFGIGPEEPRLCFEDFISRIHPEDLPRYEQAATELLQTADPVDFDFRVVLPRKEVRWLTSRAYLEASEDGRPVRCYGTVQDITERVLAQQELAASERKYRQIVETASEGIWIVNSANQITFVNAQMAAMLGYSLDEMLGHELTEFVDEDSRLETKHTLESRKKGLAAQSDFLFCTKKGAPCWAIVAITPLHDESGRYAGALGMVTDITERKRLEEQYQQAQKMEAVGRLAGGVAHDFNNLLTVINGFCDLLLAGGECSDSVQGYLAEVRKAGERAVELTRQLLAFSRKQIVSPRPLDLNQTVVDVEKMLQRVIGEDIELTTILDPELGTIRADPGQVTQVLMNLAVNARHAMPGGGHLLIETANVDLDEEYAREHLEIGPGAYVQLAVADTGVGMDEATRARMFEPFFTTKLSGDGTGLGLSTVYGIVKQAGGSINVYSEVGYGTIFRIYFPRIDEPARREEKKPPIEALQGNETILLVEDQPELRKLAEVVLRGYGYQVLAASSGGEALRKAEEQSGPIHLLLTDVVLPGGLNGRELSLQLVSSRPEMKILYMSGYTEDVVAHRGILEEGVAYLAKPFAPESLGRKVREVLAGERVKPKILVVDDEPQIRALIRKALELEGYEVLEASDGKQAVAFSSDNDLDLVITDLVMPEQEGLETIRWFSKSKPGLKVIAMSGAFSGHFLKTAGVFGARAVIEKPIRLGELIDTVKTVLLARTE
jgi:PAS domain S-box-containing protein